MVMAVAVVMVMVIAIDGDPSREPTGVWPLLSSIYHGLVSSTIIACLVTLWPDDMLREGSSPRVSSSGEVASRSESRRNSYSCRGGWGQWR